MRLDFAHHIVENIGEQEPAAGKHPHTPGPVELGLGGRAAVPGITRDAGPRDTSDYRRALLT